MRCTISPLISLTGVCTQTLFFQNKVLSFYHRYIIQKLMNHETEITSRVFVESLRIWFEDEQGRHRRHLGLPWFQAPLGETWRDTPRGRGKGRGEMSEELPWKSEQYQRSVKASFTVDLPELKFCKIFFLSHVSKKLNCYVATHPSLDGFKIYGEPAYILTYLPGVFR